MNENAEPEQKQSQVHDPLTARPTTRTVHVPVQAIASLLVRGRHAYVVIDDGLPLDVRVQWTGLDTDYKTGDVVVCMRVESRLWGKDEVLDRYSPGARAPLTPELHPLPEKDETATAQMKGRITGRVTGTVIPPPVDAGQDKGKKRL